MADIRISALPAVFTPSSGDPFHLIASNGADSKITFGNLKNAVRPADGTTTVSGLLRLATTADISGSVTTAAVSADQLKGIDTRVTALETGGGGGGGGGAAPGGAIGAAALDPSYVTTALANGSKFLMQWGVTAFNGTTQQVVPYLTNFRPSSFPSVSLTVYSPGNKYIPVLTDTQAGSFRFIIYDLAGVAVGPGSFVVWQALGPAP